MIEDLLFSALGRNERMREFVKDEITRLKTKGYVGDDAQELLGAVVEQLDAQAEKAKGSLAPLLAGVGATLREAFDVPSRSEILALTRALERAEERQARDAGDPPAAS